MIQYNFLNSKLRMELWAYTDRRNELHNQRYEAGEETYLRAHNKFSDMTVDEKRTFLRSC